MMAFFRATLRKTISLAVRVPVLSVKTQSTTPNSYIIDVFKTPHSFLMVGSYSLRSKVRKMPEKVFTPSMTILRVMGMRKLSMRKMVKKMRVALYGDEYILH